MLGGPQFFDMVHWMKQSRFVAYDIFGFHYRPLDNALCQVDMAFVREDGPSASLTFTPLRSSVRLTLRASGRS